MHTGITLRIIQFGMHQRYRGFISIIILLMPTFYPKHKRIVGHALRMIGTFLDLRVTIVRKGTTRDIP